MIPITPVGKLVAGGTMIFGIMIIALPTSIIGSHFVSEWQMYQKMEFKRRINADSLHRKEQQKSLALNQPIESEDDHKTDTQKDDLKRFSSFASSLNKHAGSRWLFWNPPEANSTVDYGTLDRPNGLSKRAKIAALTDQNEAMLILIGQMQEMLADVNPPEYFRRYRKTKRKLLAARKHIYELEGTLNSLRKQNEYLLMCAEGDPISPSSMKLRPPTLSVPLSPLTNRRKRINLLNLEGTNQTSLPWWLSRSKIRKRQDMEDESEEGRRRRNSASALGESDEKTDQAKPCEFQFHPLTKHESFFTTKSQFWKRFK
jgi:hypothetical protein